MRIGFGVLFALVLGTAAQAEDEGGRFVIGKDAFVAGSTVTVSEAGHDDLFAAGARVTVDADLDGTAHLAGRRITLSGNVGENVYGAGQDVTITGDVAGNVSIAGQDLNVSGTIGGDLRAAGSEITLSGPVGGYALIVGEEVKITGTIAGDLALMVDEIDFGEGASVAGKVIVYEDKTGDVEVPASVASEDRIERHKTEDWDKHHKDGPSVFSWRHAIGSFIFGVMIVAATAAIIAAAAPATMAAMRRRILDKPGRALMIGFVAQSALIGSGILTAMTLIGMLLTPALILISIIVAWLGYVIGSYALGVGLLSAAGWDEPATAVDRAIRAAVGAAAAGLVSLVPILGWIFVLALLLCGVGAMAVRLLPQDMLGTPRY
ncbi:DUF342 domain-containing protein [Falsiphaeobacter marinintestinus]|uniref:DUF342 domain-containing protein n=1 Tax=Falsiphaeobacter marinintestinus TaxID=1492905 RepID=UPI0011B58C92|nr:DUF342 domain-containing protein [Phaeobacter marinintestinus]